MKIEIFGNVRQNAGQICTAGLFHELTESQQVRNCASRLQDPNLSQNEKQAIKSDMLPVITWQASFVDDKRRNKNAIPSGLYMLDIDHCEDRMQEIITKAKGMIRDLDIVYIGRSISGKGVRIVAECQPQFSTIVECQEWLASMLEVEFDPSCKDWARASYLVPDEYIHYMNGSIFEREPKCVYNNPELENDDVQKTGPVDGGNEDGGMEESGAVVSEDFEKAVEDASQPQSTEPCFRGIPYSDIIAQYWETTGEEHSEGYRNTALYKLAFALRYICDFNEAKIKKVLPTLGLPEKEIDQLVHSACVAPRRGEMPRTLSDSIETLQQLKLFDEQSEMATDMPEVEKFADVFSVAEVPELPPIFKEWYEVAPEDFKLAVVLTLLPFLGTVGSKLRANYFNGEVHSPSFICCVEAPQANGKSFVRKLDKCILGELKKHDAQEREKERAWKEARKAERDARVKLTKQELSEMMKDKPEGLVRYVAATISITELLKKMVNARGLHIMAVSEEIDTVYKSMKRGFSDFSDLLRKAFDNAEHGQDYASEQSWSGIVRLFFNTVYCGTPKAVRRFFPDVEDGMISRVIFVTFPDQAYKPVPVWGKFTKQQEEAINYHLNRLNMVSLVDDEVQDDHMLKMDFMMMEMKRWCEAQQKYAATTKDLTRDTFCRRSAVIGFRAAMLAYFLWEEKNVPVVRARVKKFGVWVANCCLRQFLLRFNLQDSKVSTFPFKELYESLPNEFDYKKLQTVANANGVKTTARQLIYKWNLAGVVIKVGENQKNQIFKKAKNHESK